MGIAKKENLTLRQTYTKTLKNLIVDQRFRNHPKNKSKEYKKFEFGNKASFVITRNTEVLIGAMGLRNEFDGHTLALEQVGKLTGENPKTATVERGYRGNLYPSFGIKNFRNQKFCGF